jgi:hypothetical protein
MKIIYMVVGILCFFVAIVFLFAVAALKVFLFSFDIKNDTGVNVRVTPIGMRQSSGLYGPLPCYKRKNPFPIRSLQNHDIQIKAGMRIKIIYDCDDINFRHILVRTASDDIYIVDTDKMGTKDSCYAPQQKSYRIPPIKQLTKAPKELLPCTRGESVKYSGAVEYPDPDPSQ